MSMFTGAGFRLPVGYASENWKKAGTKAKERPKVKQTKIRKFLYLGEKGRELLRTDNEKLYRSKLPSCSQPKDEPFLNSIQTPQGTTPSPGRINMYHSEPNRGVNGTKTLRVGGVGRWESEESCVNFK